MLSRLFRLAEDLDEPSGFFVRLESMQWHEQDVVAVVRPLESYANDRELGTWQITCRSVAGLSVTERAGDLRVLTADCPAVRQFAEPLRELTFYGRVRSAESAEAVAWALRSAHVSVAANWIPFERYLNVSVELSALLTGGFGRIADGPEFVVMALHGPLAERDLKPALGAPRVQRVWRDGLWHDLPAPRCGIAIGDSWIAARSFEETPLTTAG